MASLRDILLHTTCVHSYLGTETLRQTETNKKGICIGNRQYFCLYFSAGMLAQQLLVHLPKDQKFGVFFFCICIAYVSPNIFFWGQCINSLHGAK